MKIKEIKTIRQFAIECKDNNYSKLEATKRILQDKNNVITTKLCTLLYRIDKDLNIADFKGIHLGGMFFDVVEEIHLHYNTCKIVLSYKANDLKNSYDEKEIIVQLRATQKEVTNVLA